MKVTARNEPHPQKQQTKWPPENSFVNKLIDHTEKRDPSRIQIALSKHVHRVEMDHADIRVIVENDGQENDCHVIRINQKCIRQRQLSRYRETKNYQHNFFKSISLTFH